MVSLLHFYAVTFSKQKEAITSTVTKVGMGFQCLWNIQNSLVVFTAPKAGIFQHNRHPSGFIQVCRQLGNPGRARGLLTHGLPTQDPASDLGPAKAPAGSRPALDWRSDRVRSIAGSPRCLRWPASSSSWKAGLCRRPVRGSPELCRGAAIQKLLEFHLWSPGQRLQVLRQKTVCREGGPSRNCMVDEGHV